MSITSLEALRAIQAATILAASAENVAPVAPDDDADLPGGACGALLVTAGGNLEFVAKGGGASGIFAVTAGQIIPVQVARVRETTTADVLALY